MELKLYLHILLKRWWILLATFICTLVPTLVFVNSQPWIYESDTTFVIRPHSSFAVNDEDVVKALDTISRRVEINTTFAEVSSSSQVKANAIEKLGLTAQERKGLSINGKVIAGTNILKISVQGPDPHIVRDFTNAVSEETLAYVRNLYDVFELEPLDEAELPSKPVSPNKALNLALGGSLGLFLGVGLIFLIEYLKEPLSLASQVNIIDFETGAYNRPYFMLRLRQELSRTRHNETSFCLALIKIYQRGLMKGLAQPIPAANALRLIITSLGPNLREEDILASLGNSTFALLLPEMPGEGAKDILNFLRTQIGLLSPGQIETVGQGNTVYCSIGIAVYHPHQAAADENEMLAQAAQALQEADTAVYGKVHLLNPDTAVSSTQMETSPFAQFFQKQAGEIGD